MDVRGASFVHLYVRFGSATFENKTSKIDIFIGFYIQSFRLNMLGLTQGVCLCVCVSVCLGSTA